MTSDTLARTTFCYPDSVFEPVDFGVAHRMSLIDRAEADDRDVLDDYVEAHVHGPVRLDYRGAEVVELGRRLAVDGFLDARIIGQARGHDSRQVKKLWHHVARFG